MQTKRAAAPTFRDVEALGTYRGWHFFTGLGGHLVAIQAGHLTPRAISLLAAGWIEEFNRLWPLRRPDGTRLLDHRGRPSGWDPARARAELLADSQVAGELRPEQLPEVEHHYPPSAALPPEVPRRTFAAGQDDDERRDVA